MPLKDLCFVLLFSLTKKRSTAFQEIYLRMIRLSPFACWNNSLFYYTAQKCQQLALQPALLLRLLSHYLKLLSQPQSNWLFLSKI